MLSKEYIESMEDRGFVLQHKFADVKLARDKELENSNMGFQFVLEDTKGIYTIRHYSHDKMQIRSWRKNVR